MFRNQFLSHLHHLRLNLLRNRKNSNSGTSRPPEGIGEGLHFKDFSFPWTRGIWPYFFRLYHLLRENLFMENISRRWKLIVGENSSSGKNIRHLIKISSLFPDEVFPDKVILIKMCVWWISFKVQFKAFFIFTKKILIHRLLTGNSS